MQAKLHRWAAADPGRRFDDLFNFVHDPATLYVAYCRVAGNRGANTPGVDGMTVALVEECIGVRGFLDDLRAQLKAGTFQPLPVREREIPKPGGLAAIQAGRVGDDLRQVGPERADALGGERGVDRVSFRSPHRVDAVRERVQA
jgi:hypothetical protein